MRGQRGTAKHTGEVNHANRSVWNQGERSVYMMQARIPIYGFVDELNKELNNASECYSRAKKCSKVARKTLRQVFTISYTSAELPGET